MKLIEIMVIAVALLVVCASGIAHAVAALDDWVLRKVDKWLS